MTALLTPQNMQTGMPARGTYLYLYFIQESRFVSDLKLTAGRRLGLETDGHMTLALSKETLRKVALWRNLDITLEKIKTEFENQSKFSQLLALITEIQGGTKMIHFKHGT